MLPPLLYGLYRLTWANYDRLTIVTVPKHNWPFAPQSVFSHNCPACLGTEHQREAARTLPAPCTGLFCQRGSRAGLEPVSVLPPVPNRFYPRMPVLTLCIIFRYAGDHSTVLWPKCNYTNNGVLYKTRVLLPVWPLKPTLYKLLFLKCPLEAAERRGCP